MLQCDETVRRGKRKSNFPSGIKNCTIKHTVMRAMNWLWMYFIPNESAWLTHKGKK